MEEKALRCKVDGGDCTCLFDGSLKRWIEEKHGVNDGKGKKRKTGEREKWRKGRRKAYKAGEMCRVPKFRVYSS